MSRQPKAPRLKVSAVQVLLNGQNFGQGQFSGFNFTGNIELVEQGQVVGVRVAGGGGAEPAGNPGDLQDNLDGTSFGAIAPGNPGEVLKVGQNGRWGSSVLVPGMALLEDFGAGGEVPDAVAFADAVDAMNDGAISAILLGARTYNIEPVEVSRGTIMGFGRPSVLSVSNNGSAIRVTGEDVTLKSFTILGNRAGDEQHGVIVGYPAVVKSGVSRLLIDGLRLENLGGDGFQYNQNPMEGAFAGAQLSNCFARNCDGAGYRFGTRGEYATLTNCNSESNLYGGVIGAGNIVWTSSNITRNTGIGLDFVAGVNDGHGVFGLLNVNHNTVSLRSSGVVNGMSFSGCDFYEGPIQLINTAGFKFYDGVVDVNALTFDGSIGIKFAVSLGDAYTGSYSLLNGSQVDWSGSTPRTSNMPSWIGRRAAGVFTRGNETFVGTPPGYDAANQADALRLYVRSGGTGYFGTASAAIAWWETVGFSFLTRNFHQNVTAPASNPTNGGFLYAETGAGKWRGSAGTVTTFGPADPHCPTCGRDFALEYKNETFDEHLAVCLPCLITSLRAAGIDASKFLIAEKMAS